MILRLAHVTHVVGVLVDKTANPRNVRSLSRFSSFSTTLSLTSVFNKRLEHHRLRRGRAKSNGFNMTDNKNMIIDCDCGVDDALALLLALKSDWTILAITSCFGNTSVGNAADNVMRVLNVCNRTNIPVYLGSDSPLVDPLNRSKNFDSSFHADDGFGGVSDQFPIGNQKIREGYASVALCKYARERPKEITLVALGPLTNLVVSKRLDPNFDENLKELVVMGGNVDGIGNITPTSEFNFYVDPEAAHTVLKEFKCPITILPWETCLRAKLPYPWLDQWLDYETPVGKLIRKLIARSVQISRARLDDPVQGYHVPDLLAMAALTNPELVKDVINNPAWVELSGFGSRGMMIVDRRGSHKRDKTLPLKRIVLDLHLKPLLDVLELLTSENWTR